MCHVRIIPLSFLHGIAEVFVDQQCHRSLSPESIARRFEKTFPVVLNIAGGLKGISEKHNMIASRITLRGCWLKEETISPYLVLRGFRCARHRDSVNVVGRLSTPRKTSRLLDGPHIQPKSSRVITVRI